MLKPFAVVSDSHYDGSPNGRLSECVRLHDWIADDLDARDVDGPLLHAGDVFEGLGATTAPERIAFATWVRKVARRRPLLVVRGNHDPIGELPLYAMLGTDHPVVVAESVTLVRFEDADLEVVCVPWPRKGLAMIDEVRSIAALSTSRISGGVDFDQGAGVREALRSILAWYGTLPRQCSRRVVVAHAMISGAKTSTGQPLVGVDCEIALEDLALCEPDAIFLGHVHAAQGWRVACPSGRVVDAMYVGSGRRTDFGEAEEKRYLHVTSAPSIILDKQFRFESVAIPATPLLLLEWTWDAAAGFFRARVDSGVPGQPGANWSDVGPAHCRLRATIPTDQREAARSALAMVVADAARHGVDVDVEEIPVVVQRARCPEIAEAASIVEEAELCWTAKGVQIEDSRRPRVLELAQAIDVHVRLQDPRDRTRRGGVRFDWIEFAGLGPFSEAQRFDFGKLKGPVVAVCGANEAGKSTFLELLRALVYRSTATRDELGALATSRKSCLRGQFEMGGKTWLATHTMDAATKDGASALSDGVKCHTEHGKRTEFDDAVLSLMPPVDVFDAGQFTAQGAGGFLLMGPAARVELTQVVLGIDGVEARAVEARARLKDGVSARDLLAVRLEEAQARVGDLVALAAAVDAAVLHVEQSRLAVEAAEAAKAEVERETREVESRHAAAVEAMKDVETARAKHDAAARKLNEARRALTALEGRADVQRRTLAGAAEVKAAKESITALEAAKTAAETTLRETQEFARKTESVIVERRRALADAQQQEAVAARGAAAARKAADDLSKARTVADTAVDARAQLVAAEKAVAVAEERIAGLSAEHAKLEEARHGVKDRRLGDMRHGYELIAADDVRDVLVSEFASTMLDADTAIERAADDSPAKIAAVVARIQALDVEMRDSADQARQHRAKLATAEAAAALLSHLETATAPLESCLVSQREAKADAEKARADVDQAVLRLGAQQKATDSDKAAAAAAFTAFAQAHRIAGRAEEVAAAESTLREISAQMPAASEACKAAEREALDAPAPTDVPPSPPDLTAQRRRLFDANGAISDANGAVGRAQTAQASAETRLAVAREAAALVEGVREKHAAATSLVSDLALLAETFGRDGIQALKVDAAVPEIAATVNDLLHSCFGSRWTVRIAKTKPVGGKGREQEVFDVMVTDGKTGIERNAKSNSGGAKVPISEALSLAMTVLACRRSGADRPTLVRDESAAALDPQNAKAYVEMLRLAAKRVGADHILIVSHNQAVWSLADSRVLVANGRVSIE